MPYKRTSQIIDELPLPITIRVDRQLKELIKKTAKSVGMTQQELCVEAIKAYLEIDPIIEKKLTNRVKAWANLSTYRPCTLSRIGLKIMLVKDLRVGDKLSLKGEWNECCVEVVKKHKSCLSGYIWIICQGSHSLFEELWREDMDLSDNSLIEIVR